MKLARLSPTTPLSSTSSINHINPPSPLTLQLTPNLTSSLELYPMNTFSCSGSPNILNETPTSPLTVTSCPLNESPRLFTRHSSSHIGRLKRRSTEPMRSSISLEFTKRVAAECDQLYPKNPKIKQISLISIEQYKNLINSKSKRVITIDSRYPYEYNAGHIINSINIWSDNDIFQQLQPLEEIHNNIKPVLIIYCEFSQKRGPLIAKKIRELDWNLMVESYSFNWLFPEIYVLEGGFKSFYKRNNELCFGEYIKMDDPRYAYEQSCYVKYFRKYSISTNPLLDGFSHLSHSQ
ncbi:M-phase inducer phosphatase, putative [Entamoeba dispar SAW760]|uniref:protein-tyrosine-phosphatase n=1 Tax=Entamoeba dispar (strain ATCC PRA-260 / SAW760) TaxID=370354 RepID=B0EAC5_ENTDS|nr:M-phase inducer phosphatase, putative [Entamoeba dispar SAW760]EDR28510.1 M-phase inducer phosphatase, putative [Entamoeba dispar SAW760]|eukprot:EDR28510.1 M-phase inducer phosphatase, putative [Entamoeba dispar SAW760]